MSNQFKSHTKIVLRLISIDIPVTYNQHPRVLMVLKFLA